MGRIGVVGIIAATAAGGMLGGVAAAASPPPLGAGQPFTATVEPISAELAAEMTGVSWHDGCPVPIGDLRLISMPHWGFDGEVHAGELVVHAGVATDVVDVFAGLYRDRFLIRQMVRIEAYGGDDDASMAFDNTSAFNCRPITGGTSWSVHSYGQAIDINTVENPYVKNGVVLPPAGEPYLDRGDVRPGMIVAGDAVVAAFAEIGFEWGGAWRTLKDYQHFETAVRVVGSGSGDVPAPSEAAGCSLAAPDSSGWSGEVGQNVDVAAFNAYLASATGSVSTSPCDAARVLLHADRPREEPETVLTVVEPTTATTTRVTVTFDHLLDDSVRAVRYELDFEHSPGGTVRLTAAEWSQRCREGRGHDDFSAELCV